MVLKDIILKSILLADILLHVCYIHYLREQTVYVTVSYKKKNECNELRIVQIFCGGSLCHLLMGDLLIFSLSWGKLLTDFWNWSQE